MFKSLQGLLFYGALLCLYCVQRIKLKVKCVSSFTIELFSKTKTKLKTRPRITTQDEYRKGYNNANANYKDCKKEVTTTNGAQLAEELNSFFARFETRSLSAPTTDKPSLSSSMRLGVL